MTSCAASFDCGIPQVTASCDGARLKLEDSFPSFTAHPPYSLFAVCSHVSRCSWWLVSLVMRWTFILALAFGVLGWGV